MSGLVKSLGFIGAGNIATALARGFLRAGVLTGERILASAPTEIDVAEMKAIGARTTLDNSTTVEQSQVVILAVKPHLSSPILREVQASLRDDHLVISLCAGITVQTLEKHLPLGTHVARAMPNTPVVVQEGGTVFATGSYADDSDVEIINKLFKSVGRCWKMDEEYMDIVTALSGCGPAFGTVLIDALADGGVVTGLTKDMSLTLAAQAMLGAAKMILETGQHPGALKDHVCSPAGTSIQGVNVMERAGIRGILMETVQQACARARELSDITNGAPHRN